MASLDFFQVPFGVHNTMWGGDGVMLYAPKNPISNLLFFFTAQAYPQKNSSYLSIKER